MHTADYVSQHFIPSLATKVRYHLFAEIAGDAERIRCVRCDHTRHVAVADLSSCSPALHGPLVLVPELPLLDEAA